jgi:hypothetical protein
MACEDFYLGCDDCASNEDCGDGLICAERLGAPKGCIVDETPPPIGTCEAAIVQTMPFSIEGDTRDVFGIDEHDVGCSDGDAPEMVFRIAIPDGRDIHVVANDASGQGIAVEVVSARCEGVVRGCASQTNGVVDEVMTGTIDSVLLVERNPAGPFTLTVELVE